MNSAHWMMVLLAAAVLGGAVVLHFEALSALSRWLPRIERSTRQRVLILIFAVLAVHLAEIALFGGALWGALQRPDLGAIKGAADVDFFDALYLSAEAYTTLGYGDLVPQGAVRVLFGIEALAGLVLITWSASFTYLEMQRDWRRR